MFAMAASKKTTPKRAVIKEELVILTGDVVSALILNQFLYWTKVVIGMDKKLLKKIEAYKNRGKFDEAAALEKKLRSGWIWKSAAEMTEEIMGICSRQTVDRKIRSLVKAGYLAVRKNPHCRWDRTNQYRVNLEFVNEELKKLGYSLEGFSFENSSSPACCSGYCIAHGEQAITEITYNNDNNNNNNSKDTNYLISYSEPKQKQKTCKNKNTVAADKKIKKPAADTENGKIKRLISDAEKMSVSIDCYTAKQMLRYAEDYNSCLEAIKIYAQKLSYSRVFNPVGFLIAAVKTRKQPRYNSDFKNHKSKLSFSSTERYSNFSGKYAALYCT